MPEEPHNSKCCHVGISSSSRQRTLSASVRMFLHFSGVVLSVGFVLLLLELLAPLVEKHSFPPAQTKLVCHFSRKDQVESLTFRITLCQTWMDRGQSKGQKVGFGEVKNALYERRTMTWRTAEFTSILLQSHRKGKSLQKHDPS